MRKENREPNQPEVRSKKNSNKTADSSTKAPFKPRFIHKAPLISEAYTPALKSPTGTDTRSNSTRVNWKE